MAFTEKVAAEEEADEEAEERERQREEWRSDVQQRCARAAGAGSRGRAPAHASVAPLGRVRERRLLVERVRVLKEARRKQKRGAADEAGAEGSGAAAASELASGLGTGVLSDFGDGDRQAFVGSSAGPTTVHDSGSALAALMAKRRREKEERARQASADAFKAIDPLDWRSKAV